MSAATHHAGKPRLVFFQYRYDGLPGFLVQHARDHVNCLSEFFETTVINSDCDYAEACERHRPDLVLFELGIDNPGCRRPVVENLTAFESVPKLAFNNADAFSNARAGLLSDLDHYGIDTVFTIASTTAEHIPELADRLFFWPNFIDPAVFKDYGQYKSIPLLLTGNMSAFYPWRQRVTRLLRARYPVMHCPHPGYEPDAFRGYVLQGESYARTINASELVPTCGTVAKELVRKHFEIPASRACLVTERSPVLEAAGFEDMQNCVFADADDIVDKLDHLLLNPEELRRITDAGYEHVHSHHTFRQRDQILQWFELHRQLQAGESIVQPGPFEELDVASVAASSVPQHVYVSGRGAHLQLLEDGDRYFSAGNIEKAREAYSRCTNYMPWMPEPRLRLALCMLGEGDATRALEEIEPLLQFVLVSYQAADPDPVEWAVYILCLLCKGKLKEAKRCAGQFQWLQHPELDRMRWLVSVVAGEDSNFADESNPHYRRRLTIHVLPFRDRQQWLNQTRSSLEACGQSGVAGMLSTGPEQASDPAKGSASPVAKMASKDEPQGSRDFRSAHKEKLRWDRWRQRIADALHWMERRYGPFLPFHLSILRQDSFYQSIQEVASEVPLGKVLIVGAEAGRPGTEAFLAGASRREHPPDTYCVSVKPRSATRLRRSLSGSSFVQWLEVGRLSQSIDELTAAIKLEHGVDDFDAVVVDPEARHQMPLQGSESNKSLLSARWVFLNGINLEPNYGRHQWLLKQSGMSLYSTDPGLRQGFSIFKRSSHAQ